MLSKHQDTGRTDNEKVIVLVYAMGGGGRESGEGMSNSTQGIIEAGIETPGGVTKGIAIGRARQSLFR